MKYFIVAGEKSGDLHGGNLAKAIKKAGSMTRLYGWGGEKMRDAGVEILQDYKRLAFMGFVEVLKNLNKIFGFFSLAKKQIREIGPDALILIDYAGFNLRLAQWAKKEGIKVFYYIAPKAWAWNRSRVKKLRKYTDMVLAIFPFEEEFFGQYGVNVKYVGNPLFDEIRAFKSDSGFRKNLGEKPVVALLPGSRKQEIEKMMRVMSDLTLKMPQYQWVLAGISGFEDKYYHSFGGKFTLLKDKTYDLLSVASAAVVTSGTATLETALFSVPQVVVYKTSPITYFLAKNLVKIKYISLVNIISNQSIVKELIQDNFNSDSVGKELKNLLENTFYREKQLKEYNKITKLLGRFEASDQAAALILNFGK